jgi:hypothetical protein
MNLLCQADISIPGTGKVYHEMFKTSKNLESMSKSANYAYILTATHEAMSAKWLHLSKMVASTSDADEFKIFY